MAAHRYWRITFNAQNGASTPSAAEIQFRTVSGGPHNAGTTTVSSSWNATTNPISNLFDGNAATWWAGNNGAATWLKIDYGASPKDIIEISWQSRADAGTQSPSTWLFEYSDDNVNWGPRASASGLTWTNGQIQVFSTPALTYGAMVARVALGTVVQSTPSAAQVARVAIGVPVTLSPAARIARVSIGVVVDLSATAVRKPMNFMSSVP